jgi:hypothetical protein
LNPSFVVHVVRIQRVWVSGEKIVHHLGSCMTWGKTLPREHGKLCTLSYFKSENIDVNLCQLQYFDNKMRLIYPA